MKSKNNINLSLITLGCNKNQTDSEFLIAGLSEYFNITPEIENADVIVLNTCAFLEDARKEAENYIKELSTFKKNNCKCLIMTGCYAELLHKEIFEKENEANIFTNSKNFKNIDLIISLTDIKTFSESILNFLNDNKNSKKFISSNGNIFGLFNEKKINRFISHPNFSYLKISEGCNNHCAYCLIPKIRGDFRSRSKEIIMAEANFLLENKIKEINIISQDIGLYGTDIYQKENFRFLNILDDISNIKNISNVKTDDNENFWIRLLYMHPRHINKDLVNLIKNSKNICHYIDIPIQHISEKILSKMGRKISKNEIIDKLEMLKFEIPEISIRTTFIVGFPDETEQDFEEILKLVEKKYFDRIGVFAYSNEKGTRSFDFPNQVPNKIKQSRLKKIMEMQQKISLEKNKKLFESNKTFQFLTEEVIDKKTLKGRIYSMAPEVDGAVYVKYDKVQNFSKKFSSENKNFLNIKITDFNEYDFFAEEV
jgi:ribosomal protein S12 methylthiotransferase